MRNKAGFSMLELMIVVGIIAILSAIVTPNLIGWYQHQGLRSAVVELQSNLQLAKMSAVKQNQGCSVIVNAGAGSYNIPCIGKTVSLGTYNGGVVFDSPNGSATAGVLTFTSRGICTPFGSIYLTNQDNSAYYRTQVFISGGVATSKWNGAIWE
ncbi:MAG: prepilin-type N-terminal cleavage/methylation domain-containing protein [Desulfobacterales bacterium]|nr:prepilin-type N-terminal cleavage/methylation domain-containing protein [Desulfobacterales bacterium]